MSLLHSKTYIANGAIADKRFVKFHATLAGQVVQASAATDAIIGVSNQPKGAASGDRVDVNLIGEVPVEAGAAIVAGTMLTADASGRAVTAAPAAGVNNRIGGFANEAASAAGDIIRTVLSQSTLQG